MIGAVVLAQPTQVTRCQYDNWLWPRQLAGNRRTTFRVNSEKGQVTRVTFIVTRMTSDKSDQSQEREVIRVKSDKRDR